MVSSRITLLAIILGSALVVSVLGLQFNFLPNNKTQSFYGLAEAFSNLSFEQPVGIYHPPDGTNRLFVITQPGIIYSFKNSEDVVNAEVFLDISDHVDYGGEKGLLGLAFHPDFSRNGFLFVDYVAENPLRTVISRFSVSQTNPDQASKNSEMVILEVSQPYSIHNGGQIAFGSDGYLYVALGDGGPGDDPLGNGQNLTNLLGSILRIDVNNPSDGKKYGIPIDNPFVDNSAGIREEVFAYGLRNPWRFSFDTDSGRLWVGDVGQRRIEEVNVVEKGKNYGWNIMEGSLCFSSSQECNSAGLELPLWEYGHDLGISVTGGFVYRGSVFPELVGNYIYGDFGSGRVWSLKYDGVNEPTNTELLDSNLNIVSFGLDQENELYICAFDGKIYKLISENLT